MAGVDLRTVAELMGHKTIQMTMRYAHLAPAHKLAAVERLAAGWQMNQPTDTKTDASSFEQESGGASKAS
jgi:hypothetical protein